MTHLSHIRNVPDLVRAINEGSVPTWLLFWSHRFPAGPGVTKACFSQWYEGAPFTVDGVEYATAEHFMMAEKARVFGDKVTRELIQGSRSPQDVKALGRSVRGYVDEVWKREAPGVVVKGNLAKFAQHQGLRDFLLATEGKVLVEASPDDRLWGTGLAADHVDARTPAKWPGLNQLGFALMDVRAQLA